MRIDANIGGSVDGTEGASYAELIDQVRDVEAVGYSGVWSTEVARDPFFPLLLAAEHNESLTVGTGIAVAFARSPMTMAAAAYDLQTFSRGRFVLGLGSQVRAHIERRFSMPWSEPAARMAEFIGALRAIWASWLDGERLQFEGRFYRHTLMTPMFTPPHHSWGPPPIMLAAVGQAMTKVAATRADGLIVHGFTTERYLREVTVPLVEQGLRESGRKRSEFSVIYPGLVATGSDDAQLEKATAAVRKQLAFYGSTPAYSSVLDLHGWGDLHAELHALSVRGEWDTMTGLIDDDVLTALAVVGSPEEAGAEIHRRYGDLADRFTLSSPYPIPVETQGRLVAAARATQEA